MWLDVKFLSSRNSEWRILLRTTMEMWYEYTSFSFYVFQKHREIKLHSKPFMFVPPKFRHHDQVHKINFTTIINFSRSTVNTYVRHDLTWTILRQIGSTKSDLICLNVPFESPSKFVCIHYGQPMMILWTNFWTWWHLQWWNAKIFAVSNDLTNLILNKISPHSFHVYRHQCQPIRSIPNN